MIVIACLIIGLVLLVVHFIFRSFTFSVIVLLFVLIVYGSDVNHKQYSIQCYALPDS